MPVLGSWVPTLLSQVPVLQKRREKDEKMKKDERERSIILRKGSPSCALNNTKAWHNKTVEGFEANRIRKFTRKFGNIFVKQVLWGTFSSPENLKKIETSTKLCVCNQEEIKSRKNPKTLRILLRNDARQAAQTLKKTRKAKARTWESNTHYWMSPTS